MEPITGPVVEVSLSGIHTTDIKVRYRQKKPYNRNLPYTRQVYTGSREDWTATYNAGPDNTVFVDFGHTGPVKDVSFGPQSLSDYGNRVAHATNRAIEKLKGKLSDNAGWAENIAQASSAREMFNNRAMQLWGIVRFLAGKGRNAPPALTERYTQKRLSVLQRAKKPSSTFLEVEYGWRPLINDLYSSASIMSSEPDILFLNASHYESWSAKNDVYISLPDGGFNRSHEVQWCKLRVRAGSGFVVTNPNLFLATRLGLLDPALPWKLLPYSFVVDWFINVEQFASSVTDWFGLTLLEPYHTTIARAYRKLNYNTASKSLIVPGFDTGNGYVENVAIEMSRELGLPSVTLIVKPFRGFSVERGLQAISLVITGLGGVSSRSHYHR